LSARNDATAFASEDFLTPPLGDYSMRLFDPALPALPLSHVGYFPFTTRVQVTALRASRGDGDTSTKKGGTSVPWRFPLAVVTTDEDGAASVAVKFWSTVVDRGVSPRRLRNSSESGRDWSVWAFALVHAVERRTSNEALGDKHVVVNKSKEESLSIECICIHEIIADTNRAGENILGNPASSMCIYCLV